MSGFTMCAKTSPSSGKGIPANGACIHARLRYAAESTITSASPDSDAALTFVAGATAVSAPGRSPRLTAPHGLKTPCHDNAFSLVELLVVIGIIAVLISILLPAIKKSRETAQRITCASNMRQIGFAFQNYSADNQGSLPAWSGWHVYPHGSSEFDEGGLGWVEELAPYLNPVSAVYNCPSFPAKFHNYFIESEWPGINGRHAIKWSEIKMNSRFIILGECTQPALYPPPFGTHDFNPTDDDDRDDFNNPCLLFPGEGGFIMHRGGTNVLFDDLHVESFTGYDSAALTFHPKRMMSWADVKAAGPDDPLTSKTP
jgi:prepilin-type N-terminal cleavage/methylation domain-containing protein